MLQAPAAEEEFLAPAPAVIPSPALLEDYISPVLTVFHAPAPTEEYISPALAGFLLPVPVVECIAPEPSVSHSPAPVVDSISPAPAVVQSPTPVVEQFSAAPAVFHAPTDFPARARAEVLVGGLQDRVPQLIVGSGSLLLRKGTDSKRYQMPPSQPLRSVFQTYYRRLGLQASQVHFFFGELTCLISPSDTPDLVGLKEGDVFVWLRRCSRRRRRMKTSTRLGLVFPRGSFLCGCAGGTLAGLPAGAAVHVNELHPHARNRGLDDIYGYSYFFVCLYWTCSGLRANMVEEYVLPSASSLVSRGLRIWKLPSLSSTTAVACSCLVLLVFCIRTLFPLVVDGSKMLGIMAGTDQKDIFASGVWRARRRLWQWHDAGRFCWYVAVRSGFFDCRQARQ